MLFACVIENDAEGHVLVKVLQAPPFCVGMCESTRLCRPLRNVSVLNRTYGV
jgi:hypothetical protein